LRIRTDVVEHGSMKLETKGGLLYAQEIIKQE
jgi:hypothetical protein